MTLRSLEHAAECTEHRRVGTRSVVVVEPEMERIHALLGQLARSNLPVLLTGETGTGKEIAAAAIHHGSPRAHARLVTINCAALPEALFESELFGFERGAFSGALGFKAGLIEIANGGTLFLDEVGELPLAAQAKLLRVLETRTVLRLGAVHPTEVNARIVAATNRDLVQEARAGRFRSDLLFRLAGATITLPPLRARRRELPVLARALLTTACAAAGREDLLLPPLVVQAIMAYAWPGNVRELKNAMEYVAATATGPCVALADLPALGSNEPPPPSSRSPKEAVANGNGFRSLPDEIRALEERRIREALVAAGGVQTKAAELIGVPVRTLFGKIRLYGIAIPRTSIPGAREP